jgi:diguanylate cyclase (GGDEF)-like protein
MTESLYDRFRPFKPYDLVLALVLLVLVVVNLQMTALGRLLLIGGGLVVLFLLDWAQRLVRVPTPHWQSLTIVFVNTVVVSLLIYLQFEPQYRLAFYMLNVAFATVAFGQHAGMTAAVLSVGALLYGDYYLDQRTRPWTEWSMFLAVLIALVFILTRVARLQQDALVDAVTGLRNHRYFQVRLREELQRAERFDRPTSLLMLDLDNFKRVNDRFGHATGDQMLRSVGRLVERNVRSTDVVCRYGGEEIAIVLPETPLADAATLAERLRLAVEQASNRLGPYVTVSVGVAACPEHAARADELIHAADAAMYEAKKAGKNKVAVARPAEEPSRS